MFEEKSLKKSQIISLYRNIINDPIHSPLNSEALEKLIWLTKRPALQHLLLHLINHSLSEYKEVAVRLKCLLILHKLISYPISNEIAALAKKLLVRHANSFKNKQKDFNIGETEIYLKAEVQLPYISFLRKMIAWKTQQIIEKKEAGKTEIGFSLINKVKHILQLKQIFHHYGCYFPSHRYALNVFQACIENIKQFWQAACYNIQVINFQACQNKKIKHEEYLFISQAEKTQDTLMEFIYSNTFSGKIRKELKIKQQVLIKHEIYEIRNEKIKKDAQESAINQITIKRQKRIIEAKAQNIRPTGISEQNQERLCTELQFQILESIHQLQNMLNLQNLK